MKIRLNRRYSPLQKGGKETAPFDVAASFLQVCLCKKKEGKKETKREDQEK